MPEPNYYTLLGSGASINTTPITDSTTPGQSSLQRLFSNPNFISLLAGIGANLDPQGVGGALGGAAQSAVRAKAAQEFTRSALSRNAPPTTNPLTPDGVAGPTTRTRVENADGTYSITEKGNAPTGGSTPTTPEQAVPTAVSPSSAPYSPRKSRLSDLPFLLAPQSNIPDLGGMTAEDAYRAFQVYNESERARQSNVGEILRAYDLESIIPAREATANLQREQAAHLARLAPFDVQKVQQEIRKARLAGNVDELKEKQLIEAAPFNLPMVKAELARIEASVRAQNASAAATTQRTTQEQELYDIKKPAIVAQSRVYDIPGALAGQPPAQITGADLPSYLVGEGRLARTVQRYADAQRDAERRASTAEDKSELERQKEATAIEANLLKPPKGFDRENLVPYTDAFAANSDTPFLYVPIKQNTKTGQFEDYRKFDLPVRPATSTQPARQYTARLIYGLAKSKNKTIRQYLEEDIYRDLLKQPVPWKGQ